MSVPSVNRATATGLLGRTQYEPDVVRQVAMPPAARRLSSLSQIDYADAFVVRVGPTRDLTGEQWARAILQDAPILTRSALVLGWSSLGLRLSSVRSDRYVLGWKVLASTPSFALLGAGSYLGLAAQLFVKRQRQSLLFCTFVQQENAIARAVWAGVGPVHRRVVPYVLEQASLQERRRR
jgi:hypothetical protein